MVHSPARSSQTGQGFCRPGGGAFTVTVTASETVPSLGQAAGLDAVAFPDTVSAGTAYPQGGALTATVDHLYTFDASDTLSGTYAVTITDRAANETTVPPQVPFRGWTVTRDAVSPTVAITVSERLTTTGIPVGWSAVEEGSGIRGYDLDVSTDGGQHWTRVLTQTQDTSHTYDGEWGAAYAFRVRATDRVSNTSALVTATVKTVVVKKYYHVAGQRVAMRANGVVYSSRRLCTATTWAARP